MRGAVYVEMPSRNLLLVLLSSAIVLTACGENGGAVPDAGPGVRDGSTSPDTGGPASPVRLSILSGRADMVTGGDTLVLLEVDTGLDVASARVALDDADVTELFHAYDTPNRRIARIEGLRDGESRLVATLATERTELAVVNRAITGPVFSGPHETPYYCNTEAALLGAPLDADCSAATVHGLFYKATTGELKVLPDPGATPADISYRTSSDGRTIEYVVSVEIGTINRAIYWIAAPFDRGAPTWEPWQRNPAWNGKAFYLFGGGCGTGHVQGDPLYAGLQQSVFVLDSGHAILHSSLNTLGNNCNDVLSAETAMMVKEHFIERYGVPLYTMGWGGSGGSIQQHLIADNYPGILDGIIPSASYPDIWSILPDIVDCRLLDQYFARSAALWPDDASKTSVTGYSVLGTCMAWDMFFADRFDPSTGCNAGVPASAVYDPVTNPTGVRCTVQDHTINVFGVDPATGFARRPYDNAGVQYGLEALRAGTITPLQFLDLNEHIGGFDVDGQVVPARTRADAEAIRIAYATGRVLDAGQGLRSTPILDVRAYTDDTGDIHDRFRTLSTRERLTAANGDASNQFAFIASSDSIAIVTAALAAFDAMDDWLVALVADPDPDRRAAVLRARPAGIGDRCYPGASYSEGLCPETFAVHSSPRRVAGAPLANDVIQCALVPIDPAAYAGFTAADLDRLRAIFPDGVCDWAAPPPNRVPHGGTWQRFGE